MGIGPLEIHFRSRKHPGKNPKDPLPERNAGEFRCGKKSSLEMTFLILILCYEILNKWV